jgi:[ribosomal protein S5]-alanine N-acetyltransferase
VEIRTARLTLRRWRRGDEDALVAAANHHAVARNLADWFPHPYTRADADAWIARLEADRSSNLHLAIVDGAVPVGGIGIRRAFDVSRLTGDLGYWLTPSAWGRGFATEAVRALTEHAFRDSDFQRLEARVLEWNPASCRVLEKSGYVQDARLARAAVKEGTVMDVWLYSRVRGA